jgi:hypothetical protein
LTVKELRLAALKRQVTRLDSQLAELARISNRFAQTRFTVFLAATIITITLLITAGLRQGFIAALAGIIAVFVLARFHRRVKDAITCFGIWRSIKLTHIARIELDWSHLPPAALMPEHPGYSFDIDLDLTGEHGLHRLLDTSISREGSRRLLDWLGTTTPDPQIITERQKLIGELIPLVTFRDKLRLRAALGSTRRWQGEHLLAWITHAVPALNVPPRLLWGLILLAVINAALFVLSKTAVLPPYWGLSFVVYAGIYLTYVQRLGDPFASALTLSDPLNELHAIFDHLETYCYGQNSRLKALCAPFLENERRPSIQLRRLTRIISAASVRGNPLLWTLISSVFPWDVVVAYWLNKRREAIIHLLPQWLEVWFELEALISLANFAYLNPDYTFPELDEKAIFTAHALGHPLIADAARVTNDFTLSQLGEVALITGSNMSGKSTFLRTLGLNLCLTYAGGPVCAASLHTLPFRLFTSIRVTDSVTDGISYFYAEVKRLKALLDALEIDHPLPLFFLIDEIFRGTNNRERLIGSRSYIQALAGQHGVGAISTHDLELVRLADNMPSLKNYHFTESVVDRQMLFDYRLRSGPCPSTNALKIMQMEGLPVEVVE